MGISNRSPLLLFVVGINLILLQLFMIRELAIVLLSTELIILITTVAYFSGYSVGYFLSHRIPEHWVRRWLWLAVLSHLPAVALMRYASGWLAEHDWKQATLPAAFFLALLLTSFYTIFLPRIIAGAGAGYKQVARAYSVELSGAAGGLMLAIVLAGWWFEGLAVIYMLSLLVAAWCLRLPRAALAATAVLSVAVLLTMPGLNRASSEYFYDHYFGWIDQPRLLYSAHSPYQKIEVLETSSGRSLHLNGFEYFNSDDLEEFNFFLSEVPARMLGDRQLEVLVVGSGSMSSLRHLSPFASSITTVELDRSVVRVGEEYFADYNQLASHTNKWTLVIDDAKHFLSTDGRDYDLIIIDVPAPWYVQTGLLYTREFYALAKSRLKTGGILSVYLTELVNRHQRKRVSGQIMSALTQTFEQMFVLNVREAPYGFAMAGDGLGFTGTEIKDFIAGLGYRFFTVYDQDQMRKVIGDTPAAGFDNLDIVWRMSLWALPFDLNSN